MRNICFFNSVKFWGGGEKLHLENAIEFQKKGYNLSIFAKPDSLLWQKANQATIKTFGFKVTNLSFLNPFKLLRLKRLYKSYKIDTVVFTASQDLKLGGLAAKMAGVQRIVYLRGLAVPIKASVLNRYLYKSVLTHIISNSEETKKMMLQDLGRYIDANKVKTIYHGIDIRQSLEPKEILKEIEDRRHGIVLGNAGRLTAQKGQLDLIRAAKLIKDKGVDFTLFIAGEGELKKELEELINEFNLSKNVFLLGFVEDVDQFMNSIDIFLLSSKWEGFGFVLVEAMIRSKPIVAFKVSSNPEIIMDEQTGFLVEPKNIEAFANKTIELMNNSELRAKMGNEGKRSVIDRFVLRDRVSEIEEYLLSTQ